MLCSICGKELDRIGYHAPFNDVCSSECFGEKLWRMREEDHKKSPFIIVDGVMYSDAGNVENPKDKWPLGHGGRVFKIQKDDGTVFSTNNLWCGGGIPENHREVMRDNAKFI